MEAGVPVVCGSTGWLKQFDEVVNYCKEKNGCFLYASNFSIGVNIFFEVNKHLAQLMNKQNDYEVSMEEIHHTQKKDAPSGTAITIAEQIIQKINAKKEWVNNETDNKQQLQIISKRIGDVPGTHKVLYHSFADDIEIIHTAHNRSGFASGALQAAKFIAGKKGIFEMKDVINACNSASTSRCRFRTFITLRSSASTHATIRCCSSRGGRGIVKSQN